MLTCVLSGRVWAVAGGYIRACWISILCRDYFQWRGLHPRTGSDSRRVSCQETSQWHEAALAAAWRFGRCDVDVFSLRVLPVIR